MSQSQKAQQSKKEQGFVVSMELLLIATVLVLGLVVGMTAIRDAAITEMADMSEAIGALTQSFTVNGAATASGSAAVIGSSFQDANDGLVDTESGDGSTDYTFTSATALLEDEALP